MRKRSTNEPKPSARYLPQNSWSGRCEFENAFSGLKPAKIGHPARFRVRWNFEKGGRRFEGMGDYVDLTLDQPPQRYEPVADRFRRGHNKGCRPCMSACDVGFRD